MVREHPDTLGALADDLGALLDHWRQRLRPRSPVPSTPDTRLADARAAAAEAAWAFVQADPTLQDTVEVHRWGLFDRPLVTGGTFGRLFALDALDAIGLDLPQARAQVRRLRDPDGWRYYEGRPEIPPDADTAGFALRVLGDRGDAARLLDGQGEDGLWPTWLDSEVGARWEPGLCLATNASALRGLRTVLGAEHPAVRRGLAALARAITERGPRSPHYAPRLEEALVARALLDDADETGEPVGPWLERWLSDGTTALEQARLDQDLPGACLLATQLAHAGAPFDANPLLRWLVDAQLESGGFPPGVFFVTLGARGRGQVYRSGVLTTILALSLLRTVEGTPMTSPIIVGSNLAHILISQCGGRGRIRAGWSRGAGGTTRADLGGWHAEITKISVFSAAPRRTCPMHEGQLAAM